MAIEVIGIPTDRRPAVLARCVASYAGNAVQHGRAPHFIVCDDGKGAHDRDACREVLRSVAMTYAGTIRYVGLEEKIAVVRGLLRMQDVPPDVLRFAFFGLRDSNVRTVGANRNMLALHTHGQCSLMVDDDMVCETYRPHGYDPRASAQYSADGDVRDPSESWPLRATDDPGDVCQPARLDCLEEHERWLARSSAECGASDAAPPRAGSQAATPAPRVAVTVAGLIGDCAWGSPSQYLFLRASSLSRLTASDDLYDAYVTSRQMMQGVRQPTIGDRADEFVSACFAVDGRTTLPPFLPVCRGSDRVFAALVSRCCPQALFAHIPLVLAHRPATARAFWGGEIGRSAAGIDLSTLLCALVELLGPPSGATAVERLASCGERLEEVGANTVERFTAEMTAVLQRIVSQRLERLEKALASGTTRAGHFERDVHAYMAALSRTRLRRESYLPLDLCGGRTDQRAVALTRDVIVRFGRLIRYWPAISRNGRDLTAADRARA